MKRPSFHVSRRAGLALIVLASTAACTEGLANAPGIHRPWTQEDFDHDAVANGPESCSKEGRDPLAARGERRRVCPEQPEVEPRRNVTP